MGYSGLECDLWRLEDGALRGVFSGCGITAASVYGHYDLAHDLPKVSREKMNRHLELAAEFGVGTILAIPGFFRPEDDREDFFARTCEQLSVLCGMAVQYGITVTVEDFDDVNSPCCNIAGLERLLSGSEGLRWTFDTGNFAYSLEDAGEAYNRLSPYIVHVHLKDRAYTRLCEGDDAKADVSGRLMYSCAVGSGSVDVRGIVSRLMESGWSGSLSAEHFGAADQLSCMERSAAFIRGLVEV